jgi:hypothetical protein
MSTRRLSGRIEVQGWNFKEANGTPSVPNVAFSFGLKVFVVFSANRLVPFLDWFGFFFLIFCLSQGIGTFEALLV